MTHRKKFVFFFIVIHTDIWAIRYETTYIIILIVVHYQNISTRVQKSTSFGQFIYYNYLFILVYYFVVSFKNQVQFTSFPSIISYLLYYLLLNYFTCNKRIINMNDKPQQIHLKYRLSSLVEFTTLLILCVSIIVIFELYHIEVTSLTII